MSIHPNAIPSDDMDTKISYREKYPITKLVFNGLDSLVWDTSQKIEFFRSNSVSPPDSKMAENFISLE